MSAAATFGAYGKIPSLGDFFTDGLPLEFKEPWDDFVQELLISGANHFGEIWGSVYLTAPIWRFTLARGLAGSGVAIGIVMPSVDRVGRRFPLTLAVNLNEEVELAGLHIGATDTFEALEAAALAQLADGTSRQGLREVLSTLELPNAASSFRKTTGAGATKLSTAGTSTLNSALAALAFKEQVGECTSIWSARLQSGERVLAFEGMPSRHHAPLFFEPDLDPNSLALVEGVRDQAAL